MPVYPGDPEVRIASALTVAGDGANVLSLGLGSHSGHPRRRAAARRVTAGRPWTNYRWRCSAGPAELVDRPRRGVAAAPSPPRTFRGSPRPAARPQRAPADPARILLLHTGCAAAWGTDELPEAPVARRRRGAADRGPRLPRRGPGCLQRGPQLPMPRAVVSAAAQRFPAHDILAGNGCIIVENLTGPRAGPARPWTSGSGVEVFLFPLSIPGADGAPIRASGPDPGGSSSRTASASPCDHNLEPQTRCRTPQTV